MKKTADQKQVSAAERKQRVVTGLRDLRYGLFDDDDAVNALLDDLIEIMEELDVTVITRDEVTEKRAEDNETISSFRKSWAEASCGDVRPVSELWDGIE